MVALLCGCHRIDFGFCEIDDLEDAEAIETFHDFCQTIAAVDGRLSPIAQVKCELEGRDYLAALLNRGFVVAGAPYEITAYEVDDDGGGGLAFLYGQWDESCAALRVGRRADEIDRAHLLRTLGQWETVKGNAVVYPPDAADDNEPAILDLLSPDSREP